MMTGGSATKGLKPPRDVLNYGERLYQKGIKRKEEFERHVRAARSEQERAALDDLSFQPKINDISREIPRASRGEKTEDILISYAR
jgi:hypothetical protein